MKRLTLLVCLVAVPLAIFATAHEPYQGDFDLDGDVDFKDFLTFASNYGKTGGSTTPITRVDTVWVFVPTNIDSGGNQGTQTDSLSIPPGLAGLDVHRTAVPTGLKIEVAYLDYYGNRIRATPDVPKWRNPDNITVIITYDFGPESYRFDDVIYRRSYYSNGLQHKLEILIPKTEISVGHWNNIYIRNNVTHYTARVVVEFDGVPYSGAS